MKEIKTRASKWRKPTAGIKRYVGPTTTVVGCSQYRVGDVLTIATSDGKGKTVEVIAIEDGRIAIREVLT
jgi:hypothetical protein